MARAAGAVKRATELARTTGRRAARKRGSEREAIVEKIKEGRSKTEKVVKGGR